MIIARKHLAAITEVALEKGNDEKVSKLSFDKYDLIATKIQKKVKGELVTIGVTVTWKV